MILSAEHISKTFKSPRGLFHVLRDFSFEVKSGECVGLVGPNGCGKTTFFHILSGLTSPEQGSVFLNKKPMIGFQAQKTVSLLPEHPRLPKYLTGRDILTEYGIFCGLDDSQIEESLWVLSRALGLDVFWNEPALHYSRGQASILSLARLGLDPHDFLLLDEPTNGLDFETTKKVYAWIFEHLDKGRGVVVATHSVNDLLKTTSKQFGIRDGMNVSHNELFTWLGKFHSQTQNEANN